MGDGSSGRFSLCLNDSNDFDAEILTAWRTPVRIEADFVQRSRVRKTEIEPPKTNQTGPTPPKKARILYKASPRVFFTGFSDIERKDLQEKVQVRCYFQTSD